VGPAESRRKPEEAWDRLRRAASIFHDDLAVTIPAGAHGEERFATVGSDARGRVLVVVYTWRGENIRVISARRATPRERKHYEGGR
jgi:hypothetical protein